MTDKNKMIENKRKKERKKEWKKLFGGIKSISR